jgi:hypothetical protein
MSARLLSMQGVSSVDEETIGSQSAEEQKPKHSGGRARLLAAGLFGAVAGAVAGLLLAPWRGPEARAKLKEKAAAAGTAAREKLTAALRRGESEEEDDED